MSTEVGRLQILIDREQFERYRALPLSNGAKGCWQRASWEREIECLYQNDYFSDCTLDMGIDKRLKMPHLLLSLFQKEWFSILALNTISPTKGSFSQSGNINPNPFYINFILPVILFRPTRTRRMYIG